MSDKERLNTWLEQLNETVASLKAAGFEATPTNARESLANLTAGFVTAPINVDHTKDFVASTEDYKVPVRVYASQIKNDQPLIVYAHGGGHMAGSVTVYNPICHRIAHYTGCTVVSVDYRLAPENQYPAGINDLRSTLNVIRDDLAQRGFQVGQKTIVAGDSAGGAMASTMALEASHGDLCIDGCILIYPSLDYSMRYDSYQKNGAGKLLENGKIQWYFDNYFGNQEDRDKASPIDMPIGERAPKTLIIAAEYDPLFDEAIAFAQKLKKHQGKVQTYIASDMVHAYLNLEDLTPDQCSETYTVINEFVKTI